MVQALRCWERDSLEQEYAAYAIRIYHNKYERKIQCKFLWQM